MSSGDPRERVLDAVAGELRAGPLARRRILRELADHIDDAVNDLRGSGVPREQAVEEAVKRLGDAKTIANAFGALGSRTAAWSRLRVRHSLAWVAAAAMTVVTAWAAELPQASGAKPPAKVIAPAVRRLAPTELRATDHPAWRTTTGTRRGHGRPAHRG